MPIKPIVLQRRLAEVGRIRIGQVVPTKGGRTRPAKLDRLRFTSASRPLIEQVAAAYGGEVAEWTPANGGAAQWEVITDTGRVPVIVPPASVSQYMETWSGGGCQRRCDGETEMLSGDPCLCAADDMMVCKPTTRLSVMLRDIPGLGVWRLESHGWNAAAELPDTAEFLARAGGYIGAWLYLKPQRSVKDGQTRDWMVPALEVDGVTPAQLLAGEGGAAAIGNGERAAIEGPRTDIIDRIMAAGSRDEVLALWEEAKRTGAGSPAAIEVAAKRRVAELLDQVADEAGEPGDPGPDPDPDQVWQAIVNDAGAISEAWTLSKLEEAFAARHEGLHPSSATGAQLAGFHEDLTHGWIEVPS